MDSSSLFDFMNIAPLTHIADEFVLILSMQIGRICKWMNNWSLTFTRTGSRLKFKSFKTFNVRKLCKMRVSEKWNGNRSRGISFSFKWSDTCNQKTIDHWKIHNIQAKGIKFFKVNEQQPWPHMRLWIIFSRYKQIVGFNHGLRSLYGTCFEFDDPTLGPALPLVNGRVFFFSRAATNSMLSQCTKNGILERRFSWNRKFPANDEAFYDLNIFFFLNFVL